MIVPVHNIFFGHDGIYTKEDSSIINDQFDKNTVN